MESRGIDTRGHHLRSFTPVLAVTRILLISLLPGAGDHKIGLRQGLFLRLNAATHRVDLLQLLAVTATGQQTALLFPAEGMTGEHQWNPQSLTDQSSHVTGIGVMRVDPVHGVGRVTEMLNKLVGKLLEIGPELLLPQITLRSERKTQNRRPRGNRFFRSAVGDIDAPILNQTGDHIDLLNLGS